MGVRFPSASSIVIVNNPIVPPGETIVCTTPPISQAIDGQIFLIHWYIKYTTGVTGPTISYNVRRGNATTSPMVNPSATVCSELGSVSIARGGCYVDVPGNLAAMQYSLSCLVSNAASNCTILEALIAAIGL